MQKLKVLIADDNPRMASMIQNILMDDDEIQVVGTAEDGVETLGMIEETEPDLLLLDLIMPKLDGLGVMERLQEKQKMKKCRRLLWCPVFRRNELRIRHLPWELHITY